MKDAVARGRFEYHVAFRLGCARDIAGTTRIVERQFEHLAARHLLEAHLRPRPVERTLDPSQVEANGFARFHPIKFLPHTATVNPLRRIAKLARCSSKVPSCTMPSITSRTTRTNARFCAP